MSKCLVCGKELVINKHFPNKKYCSSKCNKRNQRRLKANSGEETFSLEDLITCCQDIPIKSRYDSFYEEELSE